MYVWIDGTNIHMRAKTRTMDFEPQKPEGVYLGPYIVFELTVYS